MRVLIATDGSEFSREAVEKACQMLAMPEVKEIKIVGVYPAVLPIDAFPQSIEYSEKLEAAEHAQAETAVKTAAGVINEYFPGSSIRVETEVKVGAPDQIILETAKDWKPHVIVVGSHGRGFWGRLTLGSVSDAIVHHAPCSVFVVRRSEEQEAPGT